MFKTSDIIWQDTQHQILFELIDQIKVEPFDRDILFKLQLYAEHHFSLEEAYMAQLDYPHAEAHIIVHDRFREELSSMIEIPLEMNKSLQDSVAHFLTEWLKLHVMGIDKKFEAFVLESSSK